LLQIFVVALPVQQPNGATIGAMVQAAYDLAPESMSGF